MAGRRLPDILYTPGQNNVGEVEDGISELPDSLLHHILSFLDTEYLAQTSISSPTFTTIRVLKSYSLPKLRSLTLRGVEFTDEHHIYNCPVLENLILDCCTWFHVRSFCISTPALKLLEIDKGGWDYDGLQDCSLKIDAPNLVSLSYRTSVAKEYALSSFLTLESAKVGLYDEYDVPRGQKIGAAGSKIFQALAHVKTLTIYDKTLEKLFLKLENATDKSLFPLLKAAPSLTRLIFKERICDNVEDDSWDGLLLTAGCLFQHLMSVCFWFFDGNAREMRWLKLILRNAKALQRVIMSEFPSLPKASGGCVLQLN
ncbi:putative F-box/LRR-repeat protein At3g59170 [Papaver somniferum]|uniref:putative F-box/LRR-repeat protein At3g59170 n=1 Tax=Papaver somniferum TaxID=3469 RepID=UPI000E6F4D82|nr:putative F-box/LRR-repeat protein At3g59170 [Papaver somniferum]